jgi:hypothetical protein
MEKNITGWLLLCTGFIFSSNAVFGQEKKDTLKWYDRFSIDGYIQSQFHYTNHTDSVTLHSNSAGDFRRFTNNKFNLRRSRIQVWYDYKGVQSSISFDVNERGFHAKDAWIMFTEQKFKAFHLSTGWFARPFGEDIQLSSQLREAPERSNVIQHIFPGIRDLGLNLNFQLPETSPYRFIKADAGVFHGTSNVEVDGKMDYNFRLMVDKPLKKESPVNFTLGGSVYLGKVRHQYDIDGNLSNFMFVWNMYDTLIGDRNQYNWRPDISYLELDSILKDTVNPVARATYDTYVDRRYYSLHGTVSMDWKIKGKSLGKTIIRGEYIWGTQPSLVGTINPTSNPYAFTTYSPTGPFTGTTWPKFDSPQPYNPAFVGQVLKPSHTFVRTFRGFYAMVGQHIGNTGFQLLYRLDYYDPNTKVKGLDINSNEYDASGTIIGPSLMSVADVSFTTHGFGLRYDFNDRLSMLVWYDRVINEITNVEPLSGAFINLGKWPHTGYMEEIKDDVLTIRLQYLF